MATRAEVTGPVNIANPKEFLMLELASMVIDLARTRALFTDPDREDDPRQRRPDISRAQDLLDWKPLTMLKDGIVCTIAYFDQLLSDQKLRAQLTKEPSA
jgi:UDP-glucuronate decarboxylase